MFGRWEDWKFEEAKQDGAHYGTKRMLRRVGPYVSKGIIVFSAYLIASLSLLGGVSLGVPVPPEVKSVVASYLSRMTGTKCYRMVRVFL